MEDLYDENGSVRIPVGASPEWIAAISKMGILPSVQRVMIEKAESLAEKAAAEQELAAARETRENRQSAALMVLTETEINQCALLSLDHIKGTLLAAKKLNALIEKHIDPPEGFQKRGNVNTILDYIIAHIFALDGVKISKKPLHTLRDIRTPDHADTCGISHKNLSLIWKCLLSMHRSLDTLPLGDEIQLFDRAREMTKVAEANKKAEDNAKQIIAALDLRKRRITSHVQARHAFFPDLSVYSDHEPLGEILRKVSENEGKGADVKGRAPLGIKGEKGPEKKKSVARAAGRGSRDTKLGRENRMLADRLGRS